MEHLNTEGVSQNTNDIRPQNRSTKQVLEIHQANKGAVFQFKARLIVKEGVCPAPQRKVLENKYKSKAGKDKQKQFKALPTAVGSGDPNTLLGFLLAKC